MNKLKDKLGLDKILLVLSNVSRNKYEQLALIEDRLNMCRLAIKNCERFEIYNSDENLKDANRIFNILQKIKNKFCFDGLHLIIEYGLMTSLNLCYAYGNIFNFASIILVVFSEGEYLSAVKKIKKFGKNVIILKFEMSNISSEYARIRFAQRLSCSEYLNRDVEKYILKNGVYSQKGALFRECFDASRNRLSIKRFTHCQMVAKAAKRLAKIYNEDARKAEIAGILHDIVKEKDKKSLLQIIKNDGIILSPVEKSSPKIWHAMAGAIYCKKWLGIESEQILNAIRYHTTARKNMTKFEKIIYIADCISDDRKYVGVDFERKLAKSDLDMALLCHLKMSMALLCEKNSSIHPATFECYNQLCYNMQTKRAAGGGVRMGMKTKDFLKIVVDILDKKKAKNIKIIKVDKLTTLCDYFVIVDSDNIRHVKSLVDDVEEGLSFLGKNPRKIEKDVNFSWIILDYWDIVIHIFHKDTRKFYDLENMWADGIEISADSMV